MASQLLVRDVPEEIYTWIERERIKRLMTQKEFVHTILHDAYNGNVIQPSLPLDASSTNGSKSPEERIPFTFVDIFAGIGGFRIPLEKAGGKCLFSSEIDEFSKKTYKAWFDEIPSGDITQIAISDIPEHDLLAAGFPCQPFSLAGVSKRNSLRTQHGFKCLSQGTLFFTLATIIENKRPPIAFLENVKHLLSHDEGRTWEVIKGTLEDMDYKVFTKVIDGAKYVAQHRERIYLVCFDKHVFGENPTFEFPADPTETRPSIEDILEPNPDSRYTLSDHLWSYLQEYARRHKKKGNGFGFGLVDLKGQTRTLSARYFKDGSEILIPQEGKNPRRLTPKECARLMGFDEKYQNNIVVSDTQAYRQFGNAVVPKVIEAILGKILETARTHIEQRGLLLKDSNGRGRTHADAVLRASN